MRKPETMIQGECEPRGTSKTVSGKPLSNCRFTQVGDSQRNKPCIENQSQTPGPETARKEFMEDGQGTTGWHPCPREGTGVARCDLQAPAHRRLRHKKS